MKLASILLLAWAIAAPARAETVTVFAAASLKDALDENVKTFQAQSTERIVVSYAAS